MERPPAKMHGDKASESFRLNKYIAASGMCSRRTADSWITQGRVSVNNKIVTELGTQVQRYDQVMVDGKRIMPERFTYILLNKPKDCICSVKDPEGRRTVLDLVQGATEQRIYPVGRLDRNTTGLLLLTNDGDLAQKLTHPSHRVQKLYLVELNRAMKPEHLEQLKQGLELEDGPIKPDSVEMLEKKSELGLEIHSGRNRIVRRMMEHLGYEVVKLDRVGFANMTKKDLPRGKWRHLRPKEVLLLKHFLHEKA